MIKLITYTDHRMTISAGKLVESAMKHGVESTHVYTPEQMPDFWKAIQAPVLAQERGAGFYCWKPAVVLDAILKLQVNDTLIWCDAGNEIISDVREVTGRMDDDIFLFCNCFKHVEWCKMDVLKAVNVASMSIDHTFSGPMYSIGDDLANSHQAQASTIFFRVTERSIKFIKEWYAWSLMPGMIDNEPSILPNVPTFSEHRWDQSLLTSIALKWKIATHWFPSLTGYHIKANHPKDTYPALLNHTRKRNSEYGNPS